MWVYMHVHLYVGMYENMYNPMAARGQDPGLILVFKIGFLAGTWTWLLARPPDLLGSGGVPISASVLGLQAHRSHTI